MKMHKKILFTILALGACAGICAGEGGRTKRDVSLDEAMQYVGNPANWPQIQEAISRESSLSFFPTKFQCTSGAPSMPIQITGSDDDGRTASCNIFLEKHITGGMYIGNVDNCSPIGSPN